MNVFEIEREAHVATLWLKKPERKNAMGPDFFTELPQAIAELDRDANVRAVVLAARGSDFSTGLDLMQMAGDLGTVLTEGGLASERLQLFNKINEMRAGFDAIVRSNKPFIAAIQGRCLGGGLDLISACDIRVASKTARISLRETKIAIIADMGSLQRLEAIIGRGALREMAFTGKDIDVDHARSIGLANHVAEDDASALTLARSIASEIAANAPLVVQGTKEVLRFSARVDEELGLRYVAAWNSAHLASEDLREALSAFVEKRAPSFKGR
jgi:enoyl-CoA hydratase